MELALTVLGKDRPGIGAEVLRALVEGGASIQAAGGGRVGGRFSFVVVVEAESETALRGALGALADRLDLELSITSAGAAFLAQGAGERAVLSCYGPGRADGLVGLFELLGSYNVNVEDFRFERMEARQGSRLRAELQIRVPATVDLEVIVEELRELEERTGLESSLRSDLSFLV